MAEIRSISSMRTCSNANYIVGRQQSVLSCTDRARCYSITRKSTCHLSCALNMGELATRDLKSLRSHPWRSRRISRNRREHIGILLRCVSAYKPVNPAFDWGDNEAVGTHRREQGQKNVIKSDSGADKDETASAYIDKFEGWTEIDKRENSESKCDEVAWWEKELTGEENRLQQLSTAVAGTEGVEENIFRIRNGREVYGERTYLVGIDRKGPGKRSVFSIKDSLQELAQLADTAGLTVVGSTYQKLDNPNPKTYIGLGKVAEIQAAVRAFKVETIIFDDELSPGQLRNLEKTFEGEVRVCDRTALILDIFKQRAATREATLQVELAQFEYQLPRLTRMWTHLERQAGGMVKGMGEKQIEVDKRILRTRISSLKHQLESVRDHRQQYRDRRAAVPIPVVSLVGYTNAGKSTFLNRLSGADVLAEDRLFATLDPTTRRVQLANGKDCLFTDTVGFIQKLPTQLVAAFRATLEEITDSSLLVHMVDVSHPMAEQQIGAVNNALAELDVNHIPLLTVWNKIDKAKNPEHLRAEAAKLQNVICLSALTGEGIDSFYDAVERNIKDLMVWIEAVVPYEQGDLIGTIHRLGIVDQEEYTEQGTRIRAHVPLALSRKMLYLRLAMT